MVFKFNELQALGRKHPNLIQVNLEGLQENILTLISRVESLIDLTPEERYEALLERSPQFFRTAFNKHIVVNLKQCVRNNEHWIIDKM